ncbi:cytochrome c oxidase subunit 1 [Lobulomyces angularis]|nr:cytochrome c oxidase subunit 1 [Lobulomyces angularis]
MKGHSTEETKFFKSRSSLKEKENVSKSSMSMSDSMSRRSSIKKTLDEINKFSAKNLLASLSKPTTVANNSLGGHSLGNLKKSNSQIEVNKLEKPCLLKKSNSNMDVSQISKKVNQEDLISSFSLNTTTNKKKKSDEKNKIDNSNKNCSEKIIQDGTLLSIGVSLRVVKENVANFEGELNLEQGDIVELSKVPITKSQLMWEGINRSWGERNGQRGLFPGKCVELEVYDLNPVGTESVYNTNSSLLVESIPSSESLNTIKKPVPLGTQVVVVQDYTKQKADEVDLNIGDVVVVLESPEGGWWRGIKNVGDKNPASGWFPANFVNIVRQPEKKPADQESLKEEESRVNSRKTWYKRLADLTHKSSKKGRKRAESAPSTKTISVIHQNHDSDRPESLLDSVAESNTSINQSKITKSKSSINEFQRRTSSPSISNESLSSILPTTEIVNNIITSRQQSHKRSISAPPGITFDATSHLSTATSSTSSQRHSRQSSRSNSMNNPAPPPTKNTKEADGNDWKKDSLLVAEDEEFRFLLTSEPENSGVNNILPSINLEPPEIEKETLAVNSSNVLPSIILEPPEIEKETLAVNSNNVLPSINLEPPETKKESSVNIEESKPKEDVQSSILTTEIHDDLKSTSREKELELEKKEENLSITPSEDRKKIIRRSLSLNVSPTSGAFEIEGSMPENDIIALNRRSSNLNSTKASSIPLNPENSDKQIILPKRKLTIVSANYSGPDSKGIEKLSTKEQKRQTTILELIQTERDYVRDIKMVVEEFLKTLEDRLSESPVISNIGELFLKAADKFIPYTIYCSHQAYSISKLQSFTKNKSDFRLFLEESYKGQQTRGLDLGSYLIKPVQRLCKYPLLLKEILKSTEETATDYPDLKLALEKVQAIVNLVNESARQSEGNGMKKIIDIQNSFTE